jgi:excisionase family DNA binding protein
MESLLTAQELAKYLNVSYMTILRLVKTNKIKPHRVGKMLRFKPEEVEKELEKA